MNRWTGGALLVALLAVGAGDASGQRGPRMRGRMGPVDAPRTGVERILRLGDALELTEAQAERLDAIRREQVERRASRRAEAEELRSQLRAGQIEPEVVRERMDALHAEAVAQREAQRGRVDEVLDDGQRARLQELSARRGRGSGRPGAWRRGGRGPGMGRGAGGPVWRRGGFRPGAGAPGPRSPMRRGPRRPGGPLPG